MLRKPKGEKKKRKSVFQKMSDWLKSNNAKGMMLILLGGLLIFGLFCLSSAPKRYDLSVGAISHQTITATKDVEDTLATEERRKAAAAAVEPTYHQVEDASEEVMRTLDTVFGELRLVQQYGQTLRREDETDEAFEQRTFSESDIVYAQGLLKTITLTAYQTRTLLRSNASKFDDMVTSVRQAVESALNATIREGQESQSISNIRQVISSHVDILLYQNIVPTVLSACIKPNMVIDTEKTEQDRQAARDAVEPVIYLQGQNIIREGERVSANQIEMLRALGLLENNDYDLSIYGGAALLIAAAILLMVMQLRLLTREVLSKPRSVAVIMLVMVLCEALSVLMVKVINVYMAPVTLCAMLLTTLLGGRVAVSTVISMAMMIAGLMAGSNTTYSTEMVHLLIMGMFGSVVTIKFLRGKPQRVRMLICGILVAMSNLAIMAAIGLMTSANIMSNRQNIGWAMAGGLLSGVLAVGLQPIFETTFNLATPSKLMELANPNQPLLRRLQLEAPGTYHHSIIVANLAEAAAEKIGANPLLARTSAYFHDIGKLKRPLYFKENQMGENPHDRTDPYVSAAIVTTHTSDGLQLAQKYRLPKEIQDIIVQHHGDTPVMYFYHKALQQADGKPVNVDDFRYDGVCPTTKEAAIVMLADTIEAAVRSMPDPTPQSIAKFIERLVRGKLEDGQLSNSPLTLRDIDGICEAFCTVLNGVFHERIEYPNVQVPERGTTVVREAPKEAPKATDAPRAPEQPKPAEPASKPEPSKPVEVPKQPEQAQPTEPAVPVAQEAQKPAEETKPAAQTNKPAEPTKAQKDEKPTEVSQASKPEEDAK